MTLINIRALVSSLTASQNLPQGVISAIPWAGKNPNISVDGQDLVFPREIVIDIVNSEPVTPLDLESLSVPYRIRIMDRKSGSVLVRYVMVPDSGPVDFGDLEQVDPDTYIPDGDVVASWEAAIAEVEAIRVQALADLQAKIDSADPITDTLMTSVAADSETSFYGQMSDNVQDFVNLFVGTRLAVLEATRGTTAERDAYFGVPSTDAQRAALHNKQVRWFNTTTQRTESYYALNSISGLTSPGVRTGASSGWYPVAGSDIFVTVRRSGSGIAFTAGQSQDLGFDESTSFRGFSLPAFPFTVLPLPVSGMYEISAQAVAGQVANNYMDLSLTVGGVIRKTETGMMYPHASGYSRSVISPMIFPLLDVLSAKLTAALSSAGHVMQYSPVLNVRYLGPPLV